MSDATVPARAVPAAALPDATVPARAVPGAAAAVADRAGGAAPRGLSVLAVDDEPPALDELAYLLRADPRVAGVRTAADATTALRLLREEPAGVAGPGVDAVFLDVHMPGLDGLELAGVLARFSAPPAVVFVTAHDDHAVAAYDLGAVDYLLKPLRPARLAESLERLAARRAPAAPPDPDEVIAVELAGTTRLVPRSRVRWVEAHGDYARLHTAGETHLVRVPLAVLEERWAAAGFVRIHRSYLVPLRLVTELRPVGSGYALRLGSVGEPGTVELPVSRRHGRGLRERLVRPAPAGGGG